MQTKIDWQKVYTDRRTGEKKSCAPRCYRITALLFYSRICLILLRELGGREYTSEKAKSTQCPHYCESVHPSPFLQEASLLVNLMNTLFCRRDQ